MVLMSRSSGCIYRQVILPALVFIVYLCINLHGGAAGETLELKNGNPIKGTVVKRSAHYLVLKIPYGVIDIPYSELSAVEMRDQLERFNKQEVVQKIGALMEANEHVNEDMLREHADDVIVHYNEVIENDPSNVRAHLILGICHSEKRNIKQALRHFEKAVSLDPGNARLRSVLALAYKNFGMYNESMIELKKVMYLNPNDPNPYFIAGLECQRQKDYTEAEEYFKKGIKKDPKFFDVYYALVNLYEEQNMRQHALYYAKEAYRLNPELPRARALLLSMERDIN